MGSKVLITGSHGFIGTHLRRLYPGCDEFDKRIGSDLLGELPDKHYDIVFHLAACHSIPAGEADPEKFILNNCWGTTRLMRKYHNARFINISSGLVNNINSVYAATKAYTEAIGQTHDNCLSVRLYNVFGELQTPESGMFVPKLLSTFFRGEDLTILGDGMQFRDFTYVGDVVKNLKLLAESTRTGLAHLGYGEAVSIMRMIEIVYGYKPNITHKPSNDYDLVYNESPEPCKRFFGREEGLRRTMEWFKNEYYSS